MQSNVSKVICSVWHSVLRKICDIGWHLVVARTWSILSIPAKTLSVRRTNTEWWTVICSIKWILAWAWDWNTTWNAPIVSLACSNFNISKVLFWYVEFRIICSWTRSHFIACLYVSLNTHCKCGRLCLCSHISGVLIPWTWYCILWKLVSLAPSETSILFQVGPIELNVKCAWTR